jgi:antirestriction protein ArdC
VVTKKAYRGINQLLLGWTAYGSPAWASYDQWKAKGMPVRLGEKGSMIVYFKLIEIKELDATGQPKKIPMLKHYTVFNAEQCENYVAEPVEIVEDSTELERVIEADTFFKKTGARIRYINQDRAYYSPWTMKFACRTLTALLMPRATTPRLDMRLCIGLDTNLA